MRFHRYFCLAVMVAASAHFTEISRASILLDGKTLGYQYLFPSNGDVLYSTSFVVGAGVEVSGLFGPSSPFGATINVSDTNVSVNYFQTVHWSTGAFNGIRLYDVLNTIAPITSVTLNGATNIPGLTAANVTFDADNIYVNWQGLNPPSGSIVSLDINGGDQGAVPELASLCTWGILSLVAGAWYRRARY